MTPPPPQPAAPRSRSGSGILSTQLGSGILILAIACRPPDPKDTAQPADSAPPLHSDSSAHSGETGTPIDSDPNCIDYTEIVAACQSLVTPGDRVEFYESIDPTSATLAADLHTLLSDTHDGVSYDDLWEVFPSTDAREDGSVWDIYTDTPGATPAVVFQFGEDQCGAYTAEGDCYNREHLWAQAWTGGGSPFKSDLHHLLPTDGWVNNIRDNLNFGPVSEADTTTGNGGLRGESALCDYHGDLFEPIDAYKGDVARALLYVHLRYRGEDSGWPGSDGTTGAELAPWFESVLVAWHLQDPPSDKERARNDAVEAIQGNRNPFVDHPEYACLAL